MCRAQISVLTAHFACMHSALSWCMSNGAAKDVLLRGCLMASSLVVPWLFCMVALL